MNLKDSIAEQVRPVVEAAGFFLEEVFTSNPGNHRVVTCMVDGNKPMSMDEITLVSREISTKLDESSLLTDSFTLEVTSPGIERPLTLPRHWNKNLTRLVKVVLNDDREFSGRLTQFDERVVVLVENIKGRMKSHEIDFSEIKRAVVEVEFNRKDEI